MNIKIISIGFILFFVGVVGLYFISREVVFTTSQIILIIVGATTLLFIIRPHLDKFLRKYKKT